MIIDFSFKRGMFLWGIKDRAICRAFWDSLPIRQIIFNGQFNRRVFYEKETCKLLYLFVQRCPYLTSLHLANALLDLDRFRNNLVDLIKGKSVNGVNKRPYSVTFLRSELTLATGLSPDSDEDEDEDDAIGPFTASKRWFISYLFMEPDESFYEPVCQSIWAAYPAEQLRWLARSLLSVWQDPLIELIVRHPEVLLNLSDDILGMGGLTNDDFDADAAMWVVMHIVQFEEKERYAKWIKLLTNFCRVRAEQALKDLVSGVMTNEEFFRWFGDPGVVLDLAATLMVLSRNNEIQILPPPVDFAFDFSPDE